MDDKLLFFSTFINHPKQIGSIIPSSKSLIKEMIKHIDFGNARYIVEYGPGTGCITRAILKRARKDAKILCFETNKKFYAYLKNKIKDERFTVINDGAENIKKHIKKFGIKKIDCVVSGLPFSTLPEGKKQVIINETKKTLKSNGRFVGFQFFLNNFKKHLYDYFSDISIKFVPFNIPPCFVYVCENQ